MRKNKPYRSRYKHLDVWCEQLNSLNLMFKEIKKHFSLKVANKAVERVISGELFVNDLTKFNYPYCYAFSLSNLMFGGMGFFQGSFKIQEPHRSSSFMALLIQSVAYISNQIVGAASFPDLFVCLDWFYRKEFSEDYMRGIKGKPIISKKIKNQFQNLIYSLNFPFRGAGQSAFTNVSVMDKGFMKSLFTKDGLNGFDYTYPDGTIVNVDSVIELSKLFFEYYQEINSKEGIFTFPVTTLAISLTEDKEYIDPEFVEWVSEVNCNKSLGNVYIGQPNSFSSCCRLKNEFNNLSDLGYQNSFGVSGLSIGSLRVAGLNLPRISKLEMKLDNNRLKQDLKLVHAILFSHRKIIENLIKRGQMPLYHTGWISTKRQYSTVGFVGLYEYIKHKGIDPKAEEGIEAGKAILQEIEGYILKWQKEEADLGNIYNLEQIPAESMSVRLANIDNLLGYNENYNFYANQYLPLNQEESIYDRFKLQGQYDQHTSGGAILHINIDDSEPLSKNQFRSLIEMARETGTTYFAVNYCFSECSKGHYSVGKKDKCPGCGSDIVSYATRVVGFLTKVDAWGVERRLQDFPTRKFYNNKGEV